MTVTLDGQDWTGSVGDTSAGGAAVHFALETAPALPLGALFTLTFTGGPLPEPVQVEAILKARSEGDFRSYGFAFATPGRLGHGASQAWASFNRREWVRVAPDRPIITRIEVDSSRRLEGRLENVSHGGIAVVLGMDAEDVLGAVQVVRCTFQPAGASEEVTHTCDIRNRHMVGDPPQVRYGMAFVRPEAEPELALPVYEPNWDCARCDASRLLAHSHVHCPMCGTRPPHPRLYFPLWDEVVSVEQHVLTGTDQICRRCAATWSSLARCCGRCGERLP